MYISYNINDLTRLITFFLLILLHTVSKIGIYVLVYILTVHFNILREEDKNYHGLISNQKKKHKDLHKNVAQNNYKTKFENLPVPSRQKSNLTEKVGAANGARNNVQNILEVSKKQIPQKTIEEIITIVDESDGKFYSPY